MKSLFLFSPIVWFFFISCSSKTSLNSIPQQLVNTDSLMVATLSYLTNSGAGIEKTVRMDTVKEILRYEGDSLIWKKELELFEKFNTSLPAFAGSLIFYSSNDTLYCIPKENEITSIKKCWLLKDSLGYISNLYGLFIDNRAKEVYHTEQEIFVRFKNGYFDEMRVSGYQKMMLKDTVNYEATIKVQL